MGPLDDSGDRWCISRRDRRSVLVGGTDCVYACTVLCASDWAPTCGGQGNGRAGLGTGLGTAEDEDEGEKARDGAHHARARFTSISVTVATKRASDSASRTRARWRMLARRWAGRRGSRRRSEQAGATGWRAREREQERDGGHVGRGEWRRAWQRPRRSLCSSWPGSTDSGLWRFGTRSSPPLNLPSAPPREIPIRQDLCLLRRSRRCHTHPCPTLVLLSSVHLVPAVPLALRCHSRPCGPPRARSRPGTWSSPGW